MLQRLKRALIVIARVLLISVAIVVIAPFVIRGVVDLAYRPRVYTADAVPHRRVAIIFGARVYRDDRPSAMLADRIATGVDLYHAGKVDVLLMTGDNSTVDYNEPEAMRRYAIERGVPDSAIVLDYAGLRTYDSCYRAKAIFGVTDAIVVTQNFHVDRALMLCSALGIDAVGVAADYQRPWGYSRYSLAYSLIREFPSTTVALWDIITRPKPILGDPLPIFGTGSETPDS